METLMQLQIEKCRQSKINEVDFMHLGFGKYVTDHMFVADYNNGQWVDARIIPYQNFSVSPTTVALHYGQTVFEGMKAFRMKDGKISIFRLEAHQERFNLSLKRMCMPEVSYDLFHEAVTQLVKMDSNWLKNIDGMSLYIRPFAFATEERYGVKVSDTYKFIIFLGAVGDYYSNPLKVKVEENFVRAAKGGTGFAKCGGNYGGAFYPTQLAHSQGFDQVLWTDGSHEMNIEESGTMNVMFVIDGVLTTPELSGSILGGITRDSLLKIAHSENIKVEERSLSAYELQDKLEHGRITEAFGTGTAAVTAPIESIHIFGSTYTLPKEQPVRSQLHKALYNIRSGLGKDIYNWNTIISA